MKSQGDDVNSLFKSFGSDASGYRELARKAKAGEAQARWPLLQSIAPEKGEKPPAMSSQQKSQLWSRQERVVPAAPEPSPAEPSRGKKMARSLKEIAAATPRLEVPKRESPKVEAEARPRAKTPSKPAASLAPKPVLARTREKVQREAPTEAKPAVPPSKGRGLFTRCEATAAEPQGQAASSADDSLASVFKRLAGNAEAVAKPGRKRTSFLGRLGKR